jgi:5-methylcytosine-specific restriction endonuclease McrA
VSAKDRLRTFLEANVGETLTHTELAPVGGVDSWTRRLRELRDEEGMQILSHRDRADLKPGQYVLVSLQRLPRTAHKVDKQLRVRVLERDGATCQLCGRTSGDSDPLDPSRTVRLHVDHIDPDGPAEEWNLRALCSVCNEGRANLSLPRSSINLLVAVRRAPRKEQRRVFLWLRDKFPDDVQPDSQM